MYFYVFFFNLHIDVFNIYDVQHTDVRIAALCWAPCTPYWETSYLLLPGLHWRATQIWAF